MMTTRAAHGHEIDVDRPAALFREAEIDHRAQRERHRKRRRGGQRQGHQRRDRPPDIAPSIADKRKQRGKRGCAFRRLSRHPLIHRRIAAESHTLGKAGPRRRIQPPSSTSQAAGLIVNIGELKGATHVRSFDCMGRAAPPGDPAVRSWTTIGRSGRRRASGRRELHEVSRRSWRSACLHDGLQRCRRRLKRPWAYSCRRRTLRCRT